MIKLYLSGMVVATATLIATLVSAEDLDIARLPTEDPPVELGQLLTPLVGQRSFGQRQLHVVEAHRHVDSPSARVRHHVTGRLVGQSET